MISMIPWTERNFIFNFPVNLFPVIFSRLEGSMFRLNAILSNADEDYCSLPKEGWSVKEHIAHLTDLENLWWKRLQDFLQHRAVLSPADTANPHISKGLFNEKPLETLVHDFIVERQKLLETIYGFDSITLSLEAMHPRLQQPMRLIDSLYFVAEHDDHHITAISGLLRKQ